jgi:hypothetical protein
MLLHFINAFFAYMPSDTHTHLSKICQTLLYPNQEERFPKQNHKGKMYGI